MSMASTQKEIKGGHVLAMLLAFFGVIIAVNMVMAYFANSTWSGLVVENGYVASQNFDENLAKAKAQEALEGLALDNFVDLHRLQGGRDVTGKLGALRALVGGGRYVQPGGAEAAAAFMEA